MNTPIYLEGVMTEMIEALERCIDDDGHLRLDRAQTQFLIFFLYDLNDGGNVAFALQDLIGVLPSEQEESA